MQDFAIQDWLLIIGLGFVWAGAHICANSGLPRQLRSGDTPIAEKGSTRAFQLFWLDQYAYIGLALCLSGAAGVLWSLLS